jgi:hypothetical protein
VDDFKLASLMQQQILGPGRFMAACGCVGIAALYFPKKSWVYVEDLVRACLTTNCVTARLPLACWYDKKTAMPVPKEQFQAAWATYPKRCDEYIVLNGGHPDHKYLVSQDGGIGLGTVHFPRSKQEPKESEWPPKMGELFKKQSS